MNDKTEVIPVIIGTYYNAYGMLRGFYEAGIRPLLVSDGRASFISRSGYARKHVTVCGAAADGDQFVRDLMELGAKLAPARGMLFPTHDEQVMAIASHASELSEHYEIPFSDYCTLLRIVDKASFNEVCDSLGIPTAHGAETHSREEAEAALAVLRFPIIVKANNPASSVASTMPGGKHVVNDEAEYAELMDAIYASDASAGLMLQDYIPESDRLMPTVNGIADREGKLQCTFVYEKLRQYPVRTGTSTACRACDAAEPLYREIIEYTEKIVSECGFYGLLGVEYKYDPVDGKYKMIEMNCRSEFPNYLQVMCGLNMPERLYRYHLGEAAETAFSAYGKRMGAEKASCYLPFVDRYYACSLNRRYAPEFAISTRERLRTLTKPRTCYGLTLRDPGVFIGGYAAAVRMGLAESFRRKCGIPSNVSLGSYIKKRGRI